MSVFNQIGGGSSEGVKIVETGTWTPTGDGTSSGSTGYTSYLYFENNLPSPCIIFGRRTVQGFDSTGTINEFAILYNTVYSSQIFQSTGLNLRGLNDSKSTYGCNANVYFEIISGNRMRYYKTSSYTAHLNGTYDYFVIELPSN